MTERERQMALIQLKREKRLAEKEASFDEIAELMGLAERQQVELNERWGNTDLKYYLKNQERLFIIIYNSLSLCTIEEQESKMAEIRFFYWVHSCNK